MLMQSGHGKTAVIQTTRSANTRVYSAAAACGIADMGQAVDKDQLGTFDYLFPDAGGLPADPALTAALDALADAMVLDTTQDDVDSRIPPVFTYLGQFIDHDVSAGTDSDEGFSVIDTPVIRPLARETVADNVKNMRAGALNLDSLYGGGPVVGGFAAKLIKAMRFRKDRAKLWGGTVSAGEDGEIPNVSTAPQSGIRDLLRLGTVLRFNMVSKQELKNLPDDLREKFYDDKADEPKVQRAIIGDFRNDENLAVAQLHMAMQRLHNAIVQRSYTHAHEHPDAPAGDTEELFVWARTRMVWIYQWLLMRHYLPAICDPDTLANVLQDGPILYRGFLSMHPPRRPDLLPLPLEFSVAGFRFGHTMARDAYDWNEFFEPASFDLLFQFTGNHPNPMFGEPRLPRNWPIDWARFAGPYDPARPDRAARKLDARLALPLGNLPEKPGDHGVLRHLARRNLRRGYLLNLPCAQSIIAALDDRGITVQRLSADELSSGATHDAVVNGGFQHQTPLWFYVLKEAEVMGGGECLGPLGTRIVADTLVGLIEADSTSFVNAAPGGANWTPADSVKPGGVEIVDIPSMLRAAGVM